jgi:hypothetical protein
MNEHLGVKEMGLVVLQGAAAVLCWMILVDLEQLQEIGEIGKVLEPVEEGC